MPGIVSPVALRKESVDRNAEDWLNAGSLSVALRKESVDRNFYYADKDADWVRSLSARRAWIEIACRSGPRRGREVALRKESVDRNDTMQIVVVIVDASLSARRAWIEI